jgi:hypothetical protein
MAKILIYSKKKKTCFKIIPSSMSGELKTRFMSYFDRTILFNEANNCSGTKVAISIYNNNLHEPNRKKHF